MTLLMLVPALALAKPMPSPTEKEAWASDAVVTAEYVDRDERVVPDYLNGTLARFRVVTVHKGGVRQADVLTVRFSFHDFTPCEPLDGWKFVPTMMPARGSKWILFLRRTGTEWGTYRGDWGRWPGDAEHLAKLKSLAEVK